jgi:hypothetical protein
MSHEMEVGGDGVGVMGCITLIFIGQPLTRWFVFNPFCGAVIFLFLLLIIRCLMSRTVSTVRYRVHDAEHIAWEGLNTVHLLQYFQVDMYIFVFVIHDHV